MPIKCHIPGIYLEYTYWKSYIPGIYLVKNMHIPFIWRHTVYTWHTPTQNFLRYFGTCHVTVWTWYIYTKYIPGLFCMQVFGWNITLLCTLYNNNFICVYHFTKGNMPRLCTVYNNNIIFISHLRGECNIFRYYQVYT